MTMSIFARIGSIKGESQDARHRDEIEVSSWSWGVSQAVTAGRAGGIGGRVGRPTFQDFVLVHRIDRASPLLLDACALGRRIDEARISVAKGGEGGPQDYLVITLTDVQVTSVSMAATADADDTTESVVLAFRTVDLEYKPQKADGTLDAGIHFTHDQRAGH